MHREKHYSEEQLIASGAYQVRLLRLHPPVSAGFLQDLEMSRLDMTNGLYHKTGLDRLAFIISYILYEFSLFVISCMIL